MPTILFDEIAFGPIHSRRLGTSLGMNLLPHNGKVCSFDCIYCECGYNEDYKTNTPLPTREEAKQALEKKLIQLQKENRKLDVITFAGNGEPTMHPHFSEIINDAIELRNKYAPEAKISVLSNGMHVGKQSVFEALRQVDNNILKLDSAILETIQLIDRPAASSYNIEKQVELFKKFEGDFILQTMFVKGSHNHQIVDNTTPKEIEAWLNIVKQLRPKEVMIYTIDRETPEKNLEKVPLNKLQEIGNLITELGIKVNIAG